MRSRAVATKTRKSSRPPVPGLTKPRNHRFYGRAQGLDSGLEVLISDQLKAYGAKFDHEPVSIPYIQPESAHKYTPDFRLDNGIFIELKGELTLEDRKKHLLVKSQHPDKDIRFVFSRSKAPIYKGSPTTYADWCEKNGFLYADKVVPEAWLREPYKEMQ
jgi:hypothetical protein